ncbi:MAG: NUDIX domain-containing protein [Patescibacteria group bacterium]|jgi:8-oxo-dGTP pyrophosphatase MutT (NUDIX family)
MTSNNHNIQRVTVKALVKKDGRIFMVRDQRGNWELPGGRIDFGEHPEETLKREFQEELGVDNVVMGNIIDAWDFAATVDSTNYQFIVLVFRCEADLSNVRLSDEHSEYAWLDADALRDAPMREQYRSLAKSVLQEK